MTDIIKGVVMLRSGDLMRDLAAHPDVVPESVECLLEEFDDLKSESPTVIAFGGSAHLLAAKHLPANRYSRLVRVTHSPTTSRKRLTGSGFSANWLQRVCGNNVVLSDGPRCSRSWLALTRLGKRELRGAAEPGRRTRRAGEPAHQPGGAAAAWSGRPERCPRASTAMMVPAVTLLHSGSSGAASSVGTALRQNADGRGLRGVVGATWSGR